MQALFNMSLKTAGVALLAVGLSACGASKPEEGAPTAAASEAVAAASGEATSTAAATASEASAEATPSASATPSAAAAATPTPAATKVAEAAAPAAPMAAPASFGICKACHAVEKGKNLIGPSLAGIAGTKAGDVAGYSFSPALKGSGLVWNDATLDKWLENPMKLVPGTRMTYAGQSDPAKRKEIIAYIKSLK